MWPIIKVPNDMHPLMPKKNEKTDNPSYSSPLATQSDRGRQIRGHCGKLPSMCPSQAQNPLVVQGKQIIRLGAIRLDQDKLCMTQEEKHISFFPNVKRNGQSKLTEDFQMDKPSQLKISIIERMINHHQCLSNIQNNIYTQKSMSLSRNV